MQDIIYHSLFLQLISYFLGGGAVVVVVGGRLHTRLMFPGDSVVKVIIIIIIFIQKHGEYIGY